MGQEEGGHAPRALWELGQPVRPWQGACPPPGREPFGHGIIVHLDLACITTAVVQWSPGGVEHWGRVSKLVRLLPRFADAKLLARREAEEVLKGTLLGLP